MAAVLTSPLAFMVKTRAICNIEGGPAHPGPLFFARTSAELRFSQQIAKGNFPREQLGVGHFFNGGDFDQHMWGGCGRIVGPFGPVRSGEGKISWTPS